MRGTEAFQGKTVSRTYAILAAAAVVGLIGGSLAYVYTQRQTDAFAECRGGQVGGGAIGGPFTLTDQTGRAVTDADVLDRPALVYFGYTFCPDVCPFDMARNSDAVDILEEQGFDVRPIFISVDPRRDTPEVLAEFAANLHPNMVALTGTDDQVKAAAQAYKAFFQAQDSGDEFYLVDHSTFTYLMLPGSGFADFFRREDSADQMASRVACFISHSGDAG